MKLLLLLNKIECDLTNKIYVLKFSHKDDYKYHLYLHQFLKTGKAGSLHEHKERNSTIMPRF